MNSLPHHEVKANFDRWFAKSTAVDKHGAPLVLFHGSKAKFSAFDEDRIEHFGFHVGTLRQARKFGKKPLELYVRVENPIHLPDLGMWGFENLARHLDSRGLNLITDSDYERAWSAFDQARELRTILIEKGYDGISYENDVEGRGVSYILFKPHQLKSATSNSGVYDPEDPDITDREGLARRLHSEAYASTGFWGRAAAGSVVMARDTGRLLLAHRSEEVLEPHTWGTWGGAIDPNEDPSQAAKRELVEEACVEQAVTMTPLYVFQKGDFRYYNHLATVDREFTPVLNWESQGFLWTEPAEMPEPRHPGLQALIDDQDSWTQITAASAAAKATKFAVAVGARRPRAGV